MFQHCHKYLCMCMCNTPTKIRVKFQKKLLTEKKHLAQGLTHSKHLINYTYFYPESPIQLLCSSMHTNCKFQKYSTNPHHCIASTCLLTAWCPQGSDTCLLMKDPWCQPNFKTSRLSARASFSCRWFVQWTTILLKLTFFVCLFKIVIKMGKRYETHIENTPPRVTSLDNTAGQKQPC